MTAEGLSLVFMEAETNMVSDLLNKLLEQLAAMYLATAAQGIHF